MAIEIERRFLVPDGPVAITGLAVTSFYRIRQGYFGNVNGMRIRVRTIFDAGGKQSAMLSAKGPRRGAWREEYEAPLAVDKANQLLASLPPSQVIGKVRYYLWHGDSRWLVDKFEGLNAGLVIAEIELDDPRQPINLPSWVGEEITANHRFGNSTLSHSPYRIRRHPISRRRTGCSRLNAVTETTPSENSVVGRPSCNSDTP
jgi:adenylate cyclase